MATAPWRPADPSAGRLPHPELEPAIASIERCVLRGGQLVLLDGPARSGKTTVLAELARRLPPRFRSVRLSAATRPTHELPARILAQLRLPATASPRRAVQWHLEQMQRKGRPPVLLIDDADRLPAGALRWLLLLSSHAAIGTAVVLATTRRERCVEGLRASGACVSLVRLGEPRFVPRAREAGARPVEHARTTPAVGMPRPLAEVARPRPAVWRGAGRSARAQPVSASLAARLRPVHTRLESPWLRAAAAAAVLALGLSIGLLLPVGGSSTRRPAEAPRPVEPSPDAALPAAPSDAVERLLDLPVPVDNENRSGQRDDSDRVVSDLLDAIAILAADDDASAREAAERFLRERGPDPIGYAQLDALDRQHAATPREAVELISARARLRAALCAAWASDPLGEAPVRLGCPGVSPPLR